MIQQDLDQVEFIIFDTETTGLEPESGDRIVEIAAIKFKGEKEIATFQSLINPHRPITQAAFQVNKITPQMLQDAPAIDKVLPQFLGFIQNSCVCSYNATFDLEFLHNESRLLGKEIPKDIVVVDILKMAKRLLPNLERYALWYVADRLGISTQQSHRALSDVKLTLEVFNKLKVIFNTKGIFDFTNFLSLFGLNSHFLDNINNQKLAKIQEAIDLGVKLKIKYLSSSNAQVSQRDVIPKEIKQEKNRSYLIGHCFLRNEKRTFNIDGILHLEII